MKAVFSFLFSAWCLMACDSENTSNQPDSLLARYSGTYADGTGKLLLSLAGNQFDLKCYPSTDEDSKRFGSEIHFEIKGSDSLKFETRSDGRIDTLLDLSPSEFFRINSDNSLSKLDTFSLSGKDFSTAPLGLSMYGDSTGAFSNYFSRTLIAKQKI